MKENCFHLLKLWSFYNMLCPASISLLLMFVQIYIMLVKLCDVLDFVVFGDVLENCLCMKCLSLVNQSLWKGSHTFKSYCLQKKKSVYALCVYNPRKSCFQHFFCWFFGMVKSWVVWPPIGSIWIKGWDQKGLLQTKLGPIG